MLRSLLQCDAEAAQHVQYNAYQGRCEWALSGSIPGEHQLFALDSGDAQRALAAAVPSAHAAGGCVEQAHARF